MASIYKRGKTWTANIFVLKDGERHRKTKSGFRTKSEAQGWANEMEVAKQKQMITFSNNITLPEYFDKWFETFKKPVISNATIRWYKFTSKVLHNNFDNIKLENMTRQQFQTFLNKMGKKYAIETVKKFRMHTHQMVEAAIIDNIIYKDFTKNVNIVGRAGKDTELKFLEADTMKKLVNQLVSRPVNERPVTDMMILTGLHTGCRYAEISALQWDDLDPKEGTLSINKNWDDSLKKFKPTKTKSSNRIIAIPIVLIDDLLKWQKIHSESSFIFSGINGFPPSDNAANKQLERNLNTIESDKIITFHGLRHTHASWLLSQGVDIKYVSERLGHVSIDITLSTYTHLLKTERKDEANKSMNLLNNL